MFKVGDTVRHKATGLTGKVIGYGKRHASDRHYQPTLKVELQSYDPIKPMAEDVAEKWKICRNKRVLACTLPHFPKFTSSKVSSNTSNFAKAR